MQAALRSALAEFARGASTGLVVLAGSKCAACPPCSPVLTCGTYPACPDCVCGDGVRANRNDACGFSFGVVTVALAGGIIVGVVLGILLGAKICKRERTSRFEGVPRGRGVLRSLDQ